MSQIVIEDGFESQIGVVKIPYENLEKLETILIWLVQIQMEIFGNNNMDNTRFFGKIKC